MSAHYCIGNPCWLCYPSLRPTSCYSASYDLDMRVAPVIDSLAMKILVPIKLTDDNVAAISKQIGISPATASPVLVRAYLAARLNETVTALPPEKK